MQQRLGSIAVKPGETVHVSYGGDERAISGKVTVPGTNPPVNFSQARATLHSGATFKMLEQVKLAKTQEERMALFRSEAFQQALTNPREYVVQLTDDGSFKTEGVPAGNYEMAVDFMDRREPAVPSSSRAFISPRQIMVPPATGTNDDSVVTLGTIELKLLSMPNPEPAQE